MNTVLRNRGGSIDKPKFFGPSLFLCARAFKNPARTAICLAGRQRAKSCSPCPSLGHILGKRLRTTLVPASGHRQQLTKSELRLYLVGAQCRPLTGRGSVEGPLCTA